MDSKEIHKHISAYIGYLNEYERKQSDHGKIIGLSSFFRFSQEFSGQDGRQQVDPEDLMIELNSIVSQVKSLLSKTNNLEKLLPNSVEPFNIEVNGFDPKIVFVAEVLLREATFQSAADKLGSSTAALADLQRFDELLSHLFSVVPNEQRGKKGRGLYEQAHSASLLA